MSNETQHENDVAVAAAAALLGGGATLNAWSLMFGLTALLALFSTEFSWPSHILFAGSVAAGLIQAYFALRCTIDAALFSRLGGEPDRYERLDALLTAWKLSESRQSRTLQERIRAALDLSRQQRKLFYVQLAIFVVGATILLILRQGA
jgi:hypothetical protein